MSLQAGSLWLRARMRIHPVAAGCCCQPGEFGGGV